MILKQISLLETYVIREQRIEESYKRDYVFSLIYIIGLSDDAKYTYRDRLWFIESNRLLGHSNEIYSTNLRSYQEFANHIKSDIRHKSDNKMIVYTLHNIILYVSFTFKNL